MDGFSFAIPQFEDYLYYWHLTTPFGCITAPKGKKTKELAKEEMEAAVCKIMETVFPTHNIRILPKIKEDLNSKLDSVVYQQQSQTEEALRKAFDPDHIGTL